MVEQSDTAPGAEDELLRDLEAMLRERLLSNPADLDSRMRLAKLHAKLGRKDAFAEDAGKAVELLADEPAHPAVAQLRALAQQLGVDLGIADDTAVQQRRLGQDPQSQDYFRRLDQKFSGYAGMKELRAELDRNLLRNYSRPSSLTHLARYSEHLGGAQIALKREDTMGASGKLIIAVAGQCLIAKALGFTTLVTGSASPLTGALVASEAARLGLKALVYLPDSRTIRNSPHVLKMRCVGARVDFQAQPRDAAMEHCCRSPDQCFMVMGVEGAPAPFPGIHQMLVSVIGREVNAQAQNQFKRPPDLLVCRGDTAADAIGFLDPFLKQESTRLVCVASGDTLDPKREQEYDPFGTRNNVELDDVSMFRAGALMERSEYPAVRREHGVYRDSGRVEYVQSDVRDAQSAARGLARYEGLICPVQTAFVVGWAAHAARSMAPDQLVVVNMVEQLDGDLEEVAKSLGVAE